MVFSSIIFLLYFLPAFLLAYSITPRAYKNLVILISSIIFYSWGAPKFIFVILGTTFVDFHFVRIMDRTSNALSRKLILIFSISINIGLLFYFKYFNFFISNVDHLFSTLGIGHISFIKIILPIGISFYTFETITYVVDVYRKVHKPLKNFWDYQVYIILFPKLIAGPIIRYHELADQIQNRYENENNANRFAGIVRFIIGLSKKVLLANPLGEQADILMGGPIDHLGMIASWIGVICYAFQIYFDFSGYSDMAIGIGKFMGFRFPENFDNPYNSASITEFWRRWHITLGKWMKNYLYLPLGGNRLNIYRTYLNLWIVFIASGFWHGASWNFIIWGALHGTFLIIERTRFYSYFEVVPRIFRVITTFIIVLVSWVFFRIETLDGAIEYLNIMFSFSIDYKFETISGIYFYLTIAIIFAFICLSEIGRRIEHKLYFEPYSLRSNLILFPSSIIILILNISAVAGTGFNPFIYFRF